MGVVTTCLRGHELTDETTYHLKGRRGLQCRKCVRLLAKRAYYLRQGRSAPEIPPKAQRTHCKRGHEYTPENTLTRKDGWRACKICDRLMKRLYARKFRTVKKHRPRTIPKSKPSPKPIKRTLAPISSSFADEVAQIESDYLELSQEMPISYYMDATKSPSPPDPLKWQKKANEINGHLMAKYSPSPSKAVDE